MQNVHCSRKDPIPGPLVQSVVFKNINFSAAFRRSKWPKASVGGTFDSQAAAREIENMWRGTGAHTQNCILYRLHIYIYIYTKYIYIYLIT